jgi:hypothetical protein
LIIIFKACCSLAFASCNSDSFGAKTTSSSRNVN